MIQCHLLLMCFHKGVQSQLECAITNGLPIVLFNMSTKPHTEDLVYNLLENKIDRDGKCFVKIGSKRLEYDSRFKLYLATSMGDLSYSNTFLEKVTIINFQMSLSAIECALLDSVFSHERADLNEKLNILQSNIVRDTTDLIGLSEKCVLTLSNCTGLLY